MPGANPDNIKILLGNTSKIRINNKGELKVKTETGEISFTTPVAYQEIKKKKQFIYQKERYIFSGVGFCGK